jgi:large subunit ribosomal protein L6
MSLVGKAPITLPSGVEIKHDKTVLTVNGPKGTLTQAVDPDFEFKLEGSTLSVIRPTDQKRHRALHGLYRALTNNMVHGVSQGYTLTLELIGVGYRVEVKGQNLEFALGYSHPIVFVLPPEVTATAEYVKGQPPTLHLSCIDKQLLGQIVAKIRKIRPPEPYKGKGIRFRGEAVRRKAGKSGGKK